MVAKKQDEAVSRAAAVGAQLPGLSQPCQIAASGAYPSPHRVPLGRHRRSCSGLLAAGKFRDCVDKLTKKKKKPLMFTSYHTLPPPTSHQLLLWAASPPLPSRARLLPQMVMPGGKLTCMGRAGPGSALGIAHLLTVVRLPGHLASWPVTDPF